MRTTMKGLMGSNLYTPHIEEFKLFLCLFLKFLSQTGFAN